MTVNLAPGPACAVCLYSRDGRMVADLRVGNMTTEPNPDQINLLCNISEALVLPDALEGLSKERVERFVACPGVARPISGDREGCNPPVVAFSFCSQESRAVHEPLQWCGSQDGLVDEVAVLELLAQPLQGGEGLVQGDRHRDLAQVLPDVLAQQVPQVDSLRLSLGDRQLPPKLPSNAGLPRNLQHFQPAPC